MLTKYGTPNIIFLLVLAAIFIYVAYITPKGIFTYLFGAISLFLILVTLWFFRDPDRKIPDEAVVNQAIVLSPADGTVMEVVEDYEPDYMKSKSMRITIFLSPLDVHVNRVPASGKVEFIGYNPGRFLPAFDKAASSENEQSRIGVMNPYGKYLFKQIVGILARRVIYDLKVGDKVKSGMRFGMMRFGSRMDIHLPLGTKIEVKPGDKVVAAITEMARFTK